MPVTEIVVLRKTPWHESSLIVVGLSAALGRLDLMARGDKRIGPKSFPKIDLFRILEVEFQERPEGLLPLRRADLIRDHDGLTQIPDHYLEACRIAAFLIRHAPPHLPTPRLHRVLTRALAKMCAGPADSADAPGWFALLRLVYLAEHGLLPMPPATRPDTAAETSPRSHRMIAALLAAVEQDAPRPAASPAYWRAFRTWLDRFCAYHELG